MDPLATPNTNITYKSIFFFQRNNNFPQGKISNWGKTGVVVSVIGASLAWMTYQEIQKQTFELGRQNDLEEVSQGMQTKEEYIKKYYKR